MDDVHNAGLPLPQTKAGEVVMGWLEEKERFELECRMYQLPKAA